MNENLQKKLISELNKLPVHNITADKREIAIRCPFCGDSKKHANSAHLYVNIEPPKDTPMLYYCQRCKSKGILNFDFFKRLHLVDNNELIIEIEKNNLQCKKKNNTTKFSLNKRNLKIPDSYKNDSINTIKLKYINSRLGTNLKFEDLKEFKIVLNLYDLLNINRIKFITCNDNMANTLDNNFIGFISYDNNYIVMRNLSNKVLPKLRYYNYNIFNNYDNTKKFYIMPNSLDVTKINTTVVITEGIFDLLSVYFNIKNQDKNNIIYTAVCGIGYLGVISEIIKKGFLQINLEIYADNDQDIRIYKEIKQEFNTFINKITIFTNKKSKDFGDIQNGIEIQKINI